jgi:hypothetical protein
MNLLSVLLLAWISTQEVNIKESYPENIDYCVSIMYNPYLEQEFYKNCDLEQVNDYIMSVKRDEY